MSTAYVPAPPSKLADRVRARRANKSEEAKETTPPAITPRFGFTGFDPRYNLVMVDTPAPNYEDHPGPSQVVIYSETLCFLSALDEEKERREFNREAKHLTIGQIKKWAAMSQARKYRGERCLRKSQRAALGRKRRADQASRDKKGTFLS